MLIDTQHLIILFVVSDEVLARLGPLPDDCLLRLVGSLPLGDDRLRLCQGRGGQGRLPRRPCGHDWPEHLHCGAPWTVCLRHNGGHSPVI